MLVIACNRTDILIFIGRFKFQVPSSARFAWDHNTSARSVGDVCSGTEVLHHACDIELSIPFPSQLQTFQLQKLGDGARLAIKSSSAAP